MHNLAHNVPVFNTPSSSFVYNQFGTYGTTYNQVCQVYALKYLIIFKIVKCMLFDIVQLCIGIPVFDIVGTVFSLLSSTELVGILYSV